MANLVSERIQWSEGLISKTFGLKHIYTPFALLERWVSVSNDLTSEDIAELETRRQLLVRKINFWNEETLKMKFLAFLFDMVKYDTDEFEGVFDAELKGVVQGQKLSVITDYALGKSTYDFLEQPYFYFHEYKQRRKSSDPLAQVLLAMLIAQEKNEKHHPLYGCVVTGELWYFMVLDGKEYAVSNGYVSTNLDGLQNILLILRRFKHILLTELAV